MRVKVSTEKGLKDLEDTPLKLDGSEPMRTPHRHRAVHQDLIMSPKADTPKIERVSSSHGYNASLQELEVLWCVVLEN